MHMFYRIGRRNDKTLLGALYTARALFNGRNIVAFYEGMEIEASRIGPK